MLNLARYNNIENTVKLNVIWIDNNPKLRNVVNRFRKRGLKIKPVISGKKGINLFNPFLFDLALVDLKMPGVDGFDIERKIREMDVNFPVIACSAYTDVEPFRSKLDEAAFSDVLEKPIPMEASQRFNYWVERIRKLGLEKRLQDFFIPFNEFREMSIENTIEFKMKVWEKNKKWILNEIKEKKSEWIMILGKEIKISNNLSEFPDEKEIIKIGEKTNLTPFFYTNTPIIEENCSWSYIKKNIGKNDWYPTINLSIRHRGKNVKITGDFDTGAARTCIRSEIIPPNIYALQGAEFHEPYVYSTQKVDISIYSQEGQQIKGKFGIASVIEWDRKGGFVKSNPKRNLLVGRDVLNGLPIKIELDSIKKMTRVFSSNKLFNIIEVMNKKIDIFEQKDLYKKGHSTWVSEYSVLIAKELNLSEEEIEHLKLAALFHDIGFIAIPTDVLINPRKLNEKDKKTVMSHSEKGANILSMANLSNKITRIVKHHHERFNGAGYPKGIKGEKIPIGSRIVAVADVFNAMTSKRVYRPEIKSWEAINHLKTKFFDPKVVNTFLKLI